MRGHWESIRERALRASRVLILRDVKVKAKVKAKVEARGCRESVCESQPRQTCQAPRLGIPSHDSSFFLLAAFSRLISLFSPPYPILSCSHPHPHLLSRVHRCRNALCTREETSRGRLLHVHIDSLGRTARHLGYAGPRPCVGPKEAPRQNPARLPGNRRNPPNGQSNLRLTALSVL